MVLAAAIIGGGAVVGAGITAKSGRQQTAAIGQSEKRAIEEQRRQFDISQQLTEPRREAENAALAQLSNILGLGGGQADLSGLQIPGQQFAIDEASRAIERSASARGGLVSGNTLAALQERALGITNQNFLSNFLNPLQNLALGGAGAQAGQNALNLGVNVGNLQQQGGANRANIIGQTGSGINSAIQGGLSNFLLLNALGGGGVGDDLSGTGVEALGGNPLNFLI